MFNFITWNSKCHSIPKNRYKQVWGPYNTVMKCLIQSTNDTDVVGRECRI